MNLSAPKPGAPELVTQESLLLAAAERVGRIRDGRIAVHLHLSKLRPNNRQDSHLRIAMRMLDPLVQFHRAQLFLLANSDIVILCKDVRPADLDDLVYRLRALFNKDPLTYGDSGDGRDRFYDWYDLETDYDAFLALAQRLDGDSKRRERDREAAAQPALAPRSLHAVLSKLPGLDVAGLVRRQSAVTIAERRAEVAFQEFFISVSDLQRAVTPGINLLGNRWLFQHLTQTLDLRVLSAVTGHRLRRLPPAVSLNLNVATLYSPEFRSFEQAMAGQGVGLVVEVQAIDIFADLGGFFYARDMLRDGGHRVLLDGVSALTLQFLDLTQYDADLVKLVWSPDFLEHGLGDEVRRSLASIGVERLVLGRCDSEAAIHWGLDGGIPCFQGRYVDAMQAAVAMAGCGKAERCTLSQCIQRHGVVAGQYRAECHDLDVLDAFPALRSPGRR